MSAKNDRYRIWLQLVYKDEAFSDWIRRLDATGAEIAISPLHKSDVWRSDDPMIINPRVGCSPDLADLNRRIQQVYEDGKPKKPHYHLVIKFAGSKSFDQVCSIMQECIQPDPPRPFKCDSIGGSVRYLVHYDNPDKEQFPISSIVALHGFDFERYFKPTIAQEDELFRSIVYIMSEHRIYSFYELLEFLASSSEDQMFVEEFRYARNHCTLIKGYADGRGRYKRALRIDELEFEKIKAIKNIGDIINKKFM